MKPLSTPEAMTLFSVTRADAILMRMEYLYVQLHDYIWKNIAAFNKETGRHEIHSTPTIAGINYRLNQANKNLDRWQTLRISSESRDKWFIDWQISEILIKRDSLRKRLAYLKAVAAGKVINSYDIEQLKRANILDIAKTYGHQVMRQGSRAYIKLRNEKTASCCLYLNNNTFYDFGSNDGGDVIDFVCRLENCDFKDACQRLVYMGY